MRRVSDGQYSLHFDIREGITDELKWSIHTSSAPYDIAVLTENCKRCKKSPQILRNQPIKDVTLEEGQIVGHTIVLEKGDKVLACATLVVPEYPLMQASFHEDPIHGHVHIIPMKDRMRIMPDLRYKVDYEASDPRAEVLDWAFVQDCASNNVEQSSEGTELGVDSRTTITLDTTGSNLTLRNFALFRGGKPFACNRLVDVEPRTLQAGEKFKFTQEHFYSATRWSSTHPNPSEIHVRDDCMDVSTETLHRSLANTKFYPSISIFGTDTLILKSLVPSPSTDPQKCLVMRPHFARPVAFSTFAHPIVGQLVLVDTDDVIFVSGSLRHLFDEAATRATIQVSPRFADPGGCPQYIQGCADCFTLQDSALVAGKSDPDLSLAGVLPFFNLSKMHSVIVDLTWTKVCANLTQLPSGALQARANIRRYSPVSAPVVATVVLLEYPANNYTEIVVNKKVSIGEISMHERPVDMTVTGGPPCGELTIGPKKTFPWINELNQALTNRENDSTLIVEDRLISGSNSALSLSLLLSDSIQEKNVYCGHFSLSADPPINRVAIFNETIRGFVKMEQSPDPSGSFPTIISYQLEEIDQEKHFSNKDEVLQWEIVNDQNMTCPTALVYNPTQANETECSPVTQWMCPIGLKTIALILNKRVSIPVNDLSLHGPFGVTDQSLRIHLKEGPICEPLVEMQQASLHWKTLSKRSLSELQKELAEKWALLEFQIQINYNRALIGGRCSTYRITFLTNGEKLSEIFDSYLGEENRFKDEKALDCGENGNGEEPSPSTPPTPTGKPASTISLLTQILSIFFVSLFILRL
ncbi:unnamed protein product, partial [Mesorhabditis belari]|uniref:Uncharacterized protein n=1 Tax=Mesorhabditis belari TaxID=2138241 RepID=A0AAF3F2M6_9BILA